MISLLQYLTKTKKTAKSAEDAKNLALSELGITEEDAVITVTDEGSKGFLGIGSKGVTVSVEAKDAAPIIAKTFLSQVFDAMGLDAEISAKTDDKTLFTEISGGHMGLVIGKRGDTLDALQYLTSLVVNHETEDRIRVILDTENYREKRHTALVSLANRLADKVLRTGKKHTLEPMNPYERRIIHSCLQANDDVTTFSIDEEPRRRVVIAPKNSKPRTSTLPHISSHIAAEYRQQNHNKAKNYDEFLAENGEE
ncbi:MAG: protein jag [Firmicutes bacterium]|nr:protein jag [Bacillota bacterium]